MFEPETLTKLFKLVIADILLAGDNALVIAMATRALEGKQQFWGRIIGSAGAVLLRVLFILIIAWLLKIPYVQLVGGVLLLWISWKLVNPEQDEVDATGHHKHGQTLRHAIWMIIVADATMSLDNVVAIANIAQGDTKLVVFGLLLSIPLVVWGSSLIASLMQTHRWIVWLGGGVLGHVAGGIIFHDPSVLGWMGVSVVPGTSSKGIAEILGNHPGAAWAATTVPWLLAGVLVIAGYFLGRASTPTDSPKSA